MSFFPCRVEAAVRRTREGSGDSPARVEGKSWEALLVRKGARPARGGASSPLTTGAGLVWRAGPPCSAPAFAGRGFGWGLGGSWEGTEGRGVGEGGNPGLRSQLPALLFLSASNPRER